MLSMLSMGWREVWLPSPALGAIFLVLITTMGVVSLTNIFVQILCCMVGESTLYIYTHLSTLLVCILLMHRKQLNTDNSMEM